MRILTDNNPPLAFQNDNGKFSGLAVDILRRAVAGKPVVLEFEQVPWRRAYEQGISEPDTCLIGIGRTVEREPNFRWIGPFAKGGISLFGLKYRHLTANSMQEVINKNLTVGITRDDVASVLARRYPNIRAENVPRQTLGPGMLGSGRFDLWASGRMLGMYKLKNAGIDAEEVLNVESIDISMGCSLKTDEKIVAAIQDGLAPLIFRKITVEIERGYLAPGTNDRRDAERTNR